MRPRAWTFTVILSACATTPPPLPGAEEEAIILRMHQEFAEAWTKGDSSALVAYYAPDSVRVGAMGDVQRGPEEIKAAYERLLHGPMQGASITIDAGTVRFLSADLAIWQGGMTISPGPEKPIVKGHVVEVMKKIDGRWLLIEAHPKLFPPPPPR
jgi:uncharacterized protein (TIGR02246 family)